MALLPLLLFFASGAASLVYEVAWARALGVVFGASHLAVTTVLTVYMGGQALGSALLGARADRTARPLALYGWLELGVAASAVGFVGLVAVYPAVYVPLARVAEENHAYLTLVRATFATLAMIVPTTLMGATLPALGRLFAGRQGGLARQLSFLYAFNTFGAVAGSLLAGFSLLPWLGVTATILTAAAVSAAAGAAALLLDRAGEAPAPAPRQGTAAGDAVRERGAVDLARLALAGTALSGFCALGYEVLWTRMLTLVVGTSVYSFTLMLVAFLAGIGLGSHAFGLLRGRRARADARRATLLFAALQLLIGLTALAVTVLMRDLPRTAARVQDLLAAWRLSPFDGRLASSFAVAIAYLAVPAIFMGAAFPAAGAVLAARRGGAGGAVGRLLGANTAGAILGSAVSGFVLVSLFGIERSLQLLMILNVTGGLVIAARAAGRRRAAAIAGALGAALLVARGASPSRARAWDERYFATYANTSRTLETAAQVRERLHDTEILYFHEGVDETVSVVRPRGDVHQAFIVNGRPEASNAPVDVQLQRALGHLPMLLHPRPRSVFVLGTGSGMTLGATALHPEVERIVLAEIELGVLGVARTFAAWNAHVLDDPRLHVVHDDGRNFLTSTGRRFDVITADPIHPWSGGAAYLYTTEYFRTVAEHLAPGGIASQWLPLYELSTDDVRTVLRSFTDAFPHVMVWLTYYDAVLVGAREPIRVDEPALARRISLPAIRDDLAAVRMGSAEDLLSYFVMGDAGARAFARGARLNTDDGLALEFSAPRSQGVPTDARNVLALSLARESLGPYLAPDGTAGAAERWTRSLETARTYDRAHVRFLQGDRGSPELAALLAAARARDPGYAPLRFLLDEQRFAERCEPALVAEAAIDLPPGFAGPRRLSAVRQYLGRGRVLVSFVDAARRDVYAERWVSGRYEELDGEVARCADDGLRAMRAAADALGHAPEGGSPEALRAALRAGAEGCTAPARGPALSEGAGPAPAPPAAPAPAPQGAPGPRARTTAPGSGAAPRRGPRGDPAPTATVRR